MPSPSASSSPSRVKQDTQSHNEHDSQSEDEIVPWFPSPMDGWNEEADCFSPRHEASTIELFFDLWFVANLALFTQYHAVTNRYTFWSYVAFFFVLWTSWFHVVCFDARFTSDSVWERACKTVHFLSFAVLSLVGYKFAPLAMDVQSATPHWIYRINCFAILLSRAWLALQYLVTAVMCASREHRVLRLTLPLALNALLFLCVAAVFGGLLGGFSDMRTNLTGVLIGVYVVLILEFFGTLTISMIWRRLSFKATHIGERMGLLGLIIIGEGVIGTTKTIVRTMGKNGPTIEASAQVFSIILVLVFMWILYFDKVPKYRFGTVRQQLWMALHLPFHLAILGVVEGSQQLVQARYIYSSTEKLLSETWYGCVGQHLDDQALTKNLTKAIEYFKISESARGTLALDYVYQEMYLLGNTTGVCSPANTTDLSNYYRGIPLTFSPFFNRAIGAMVQAFEMDIPPEAGNVHSLDIALRSWKVVYTYYWSAIILLLTCYIITSLLADTDMGHGRYLTRYASLSILSRALMIVLAVAMLTIGLTNHLLLQSYIASSWILPTVVFLLFFICWSDRGSKIWRRRQERKRKYQSVATMPMEQQQDAGGGGVQRRGTNGYGYPSH